MHVIRARNVQDALVLGGQHLRLYGEPEPSRDGPVHVAPEPVTTVYERPWERVLLDPVRDANPFFHLMESVWILAGRRDAIWLDRYVQGFSDRYAEEGGLQHAAYGYRWRQHFDTSPCSDILGIDSEPVDQFVEVAEMLRKDPTTRRAVLAMWDPTADLGASKRDIPCNTHVYFRARHLPGSGQDGPEAARHTLDTTVCCRSNDMVMGAYGANAVHMSVMAEVVAGLAGMVPGSYSQISNNFHVYERDLGKVPSCIPVPYQTGEIVAQPICGEVYTSAALHDEAMNVLSDARSFCDTVAQDNNEVFTTLSEYANSQWFRQTVIPMQRAHSRWRQGGAARVFAMGELAASMPARSDWARAAVEWMDRRLRK